MSIFRPILLSFSLILAGAFVAPVAIAVETHSSGKQCNNRQGAGGKFSQEFFVFFEPSSAALDDEDKAIIRRVHDRAEGQHAVQICLFGKASKTGNPASNAALALRRSESVAAELRRLGWERSRIAIEPEGETWGWLDDLTWEAGEDRRVRIRLSQ
jgi:outer membrane protein OmpA-like peptidoglycan-associated protein